MPPPIEGLGGKSFGEQIVRGLLGGIFEAARKHLGLPEKPMAEDWLAALQAGCRAMRQSQMERQGFSAVPHRAKPPQGPRGSPPPVNQGKKPEEDEEGDD